VAGRPKTSRTHKGTPKERFLAALPKVGTVMAAARAAGVGRSTVYGWRDEDPDFAAAMDEADEAATQELERVAIARAKRKSDPLMALLLKAKRPEVYRERSEVKHTGPMIKTYKGIDPDKAV
jgi:hypothetical protein